MKTLYQRYPDYPAIVARFIETNPLRSVHARIQEGVTTWRQLSQAGILYVMHLPPESLRSGGTGKHCRMLYRNLKEFLPFVVYPEGNVLVLQEPNHDTFRTNESGNQAERLITDDKTEMAFSRVLKEVRPRIVHFQHLLGMPLNLIRIARDQGAKVVISCHDGYFLCPDWRLLEMGETYCDGCVGASRQGTRSRLSPPFQDSAVVQLLRSPLLGRELSRSRFHLSLPPPQDFRFSPQE